ncbi:hypothetical protein GXW83_03395 [Streptacidiphilus sp. PB12-B1b]|uniref:hypothetical protein n=1 Tax=Streptacidiphilus sp. PB12-B1b TaxID=2705012 RepID=UPI0015FCA6C7|nr:hypothetical protein [Streptacidiphilus sp. PB12-B1b]QMU74950.1 hypothetical protein GXW83_03395 [Streptacidiphilus sp. PB12-B1b]
MSINRAVLALGAVAVVGVATVGASVAVANSKGKPVPNAAVLTGSTWTQFKPLCYNAGKPLTAKQQAACTALVQKQLSSPSALKTITIANTNSTFSINLDQLAANKGWTAGGQNGQLVPVTKHAYAGPLSVTPVLTSTSQSTGAASLADNGPVLIIEGQRSSTSPNAPVYGEWLFQLKVKGS